MCSYKKIHARRMFALHRMVCKYLLTERIFTLCYDNNNFLYEEDILETSYVYITVDIVIFIYFTIIL